MMRRVVMMVSVLAGCFLVAAPDVSAQGVPDKAAKASKANKANKAAKAAADCRIDTTASWWQSQRAYSDDSRRDWTDDALRQRLLVAAGYDANAAFAAELGWRILGAQPEAPGDSAVRAQLRAMAAKRTWPTRTVVGVAGVHAAGLIAQRDSTLADFAMHRMMEAGPGESSSAELAVLQDAQRLRAGRGQLFGTQFTRDASGALSLAKLEDSTHVDMRREGGWLPPLALSRCLANAAK